MIGDARRSTAPDRPPSHASKSTWRAWARRQRKRWATRTEHRRAAELAVAELLRGWRIWQEARWALVYLAFGDELDPLAVLPPGPARAVPRLAITRTTGLDAPLSVHELDRSALERHPSGFDQPPRDAPQVPLSDIDLVLVPGLCFDVRGVRLGYGLGLYDRTLRRLPAGAVTVGVACEKLVVPELPSEPHDVAVHWLLSEAGLRKAEHAPAAPDASARRPRGEC